MHQIILASQSHRRKQLLEWAEQPFISVPAHTAEEIPEGVAVQDVPVHIAREKALTVKKNLATFEARRFVPEEGVPILAADTIVLLGTEIINKPANRADAIAILTRLSGQIHQVITGVVILDGEKEISFSDITEVEFHPLTQDQIEFYVDKYEPYDKAGAYAIQEWIGVIGIKSIKGDFYNVMGMPISRVMQALQACFTK